MNQYFLVCFLFVFSSLELLVYYIRPIRRQGFEISSIFFKTDYYSYRLLTGTTLEANFQNQLIIKIGYFPRYTFKGI